MWQLHQRHQRQSDPEHDFHRSQSAPGHHISAGFPNFDDASSHQTVSCDFASPVNALIVTDDLRKWSF